MFEITWTALSAVRGTWLLGVEIGMATCTKEEKALAGAFKALGDCNRTRIFRMVSENEGICACKILEAFDITQPTLSHHMKQLVEAGLVTGEKVGKWMHYSVDRNRADELAAFLRDHTL